MRKNRDSALMFFVAFASTSIMTIQAHATTFNFNDEYLVSSTSQAQTAFGTSNGFTSAGLYQLTNTVTPTINRLGGVTSSIPGEFVQNTNHSQALQLFGWGQSLNYGQQVANVYNLTNPANGAISLQYKTGTSGFISSGTVTAFDLNSIDFKGPFQSEDLDFTLEGFLGGNLVDSKVLDVTGNTLSTFTENWTNVDTVEIVSTASLPVNWGSGSLYMDNVVINNPIASATPEPSSLTLLTTGLLGLGGLIRRKLCR